MKPKKRLVPDSVLPPINFSLENQAMESTDKYNAKNHEAFFQSFFDGGVSNYNVPDLEKKLIVQTRKLEQEDLGGYVKAQYLKEHQINL